ncbi:unnamed protein product [Rhizoctonia solani]|uniref:Uncharacterized protein n=1 Tax=Rhizoctonia solani TaxID=456999 RepID=A0A8H3CYG5_9AGAM|nr:unnamed protein product [Rhizoctonia solani]
MDSPLFKSFKLGVRSVQQVIYAPSNFGFEVDVTQAPNNPAFGHNPSTSAEANNQARQTRPYHPTSSNARQTARADHRATGDFVILAKHRKWLPCAVPGYQEASYPQRASRDAYSVVSPILSEPDDWVIVNGNLPENDSHA